MLEFLQEWMIPIRWVHVIAGSAWFGEVVAINFILLPALGKFSDDFRRQFLAVVFPKVFRAASVFSATAVLSGLTLVYVYTQGNWGMLLEGRWGHAILAGGTIGTLLTLFHFFMEDKLARRVGIGCPDTADEVLDDVHHKLNIVPRIGLGVITIVFFLMMYAVRGV